MNTLNDILSYLDKLQGLPAAGLVLVLCIAVGYAWRGLNLKWFPNDAIPLVVMITGSLFMMFIADGRPTTMPHHVWTARNLAVGFVIGAIAWAVHNYALAWIEKWLVSKIPGLSNTTFFTKDGSPPTENPSGQSNKPHVP
jgi:hypothetical protein